MVTHLLPSASRLLPCNHLYINVLQTETDETDVLKTFLLLVAKAQKKPSDKESDGLFYECLAVILFQFSEVLDGANHLRGVRVLIVVPGNNLNERVAVANLANHCLVGIEQRTELHADDVA